jgi:hypothetical protein
MTSARARRVVRVLLVVIALAGSGARGLCFMPELTPGAGATPAHDCCRSGWTAASPTCCMEGRIDPVPAIRTAKRAVPALGVTPAAFLQDEDTAFLNDQDAKVASSFPSPPPRFVLRV